MNITLRDYQSSAIHSLRAAYRAGHRAPLLVCPTGGGKTIMFAAITQSAAARGNRVLILVHRRELIRQASQKLSQADVPHGVIAAGDPKADHPVQVASVQTLARRLDQLSWQPDLIVIDEAHHAVAGTWRKILDHWPHALRLGVTATPLRQDGRGLCSMFDHLVEGPTVATLVDHGYLSTAKIFAPPQVADLTGLRTRAGDFNAEELTERLDRPTVTGDAIDHYQRLCNQKRAIAFCCSTKHADSVADAFNLRGVPAATLLGSTPTDERDGLVRQFAAGTIRVLVTVDVVSEGFDCPAAEVAILLRPTQSEGLYLQQVGRVLRPAPDKPHALILDHVGNVHRHGFPDDHRDWSLADRPRRGSKDGPPAPTVRTCETCFAAFAPQPVCPVCGTPAKLSSREIQQKEGELQELARAAVAQARVRDRRQQGKARSLPELLAIAKQRGYSAGWAYKVHNARSSRA
jgi:superfamily II DNA or RNA helicase